jgi:hypothetical protein
MGRRQRTSDDARTAANTVKQKTADNKLGGFSYVLFGYAYFINDALIYEGRDMA